MSPAMHSLSRLTSVTLAALTIAACAPNNVETEASPVETVTRSSERIVPSMMPYMRRGEDGTTVARVLAPAPQIWDALKATFEARKVELTILDRPAGRMGDTAFTFMRRWNDKPGSFYFSCGQAMTGQRADEDRLKAVVLAQISRRTADTIAIAVHMSAFATPVDMGGSRSVSQCSSTGRGESDFLEEVLTRLGMPRR